MDLSFSSEEIEWDVREESSLLDSLYTLRESTTTPKQNLKNPKKPVLIKRWFKRPGVRIDYEMWLGCVEKIIETTSPALVIFDHIRTVESDVTFQTHRFVSRGSFKPSMHSAREFFEDFTEMKFGELYGENYEMKMTGTVIGEEVVVDVIDCLYDIPGGNAPTQESQFVCVNGEYRIATSPVDYEVNECFFGCLAEILGETKVSQFKTKIKYISNTKLSTNDLHKLRPMFVKGKIDPVVNSVSYGQGLVIPLILSDGHYFHDYGPASYIPHDFSEETVKDSKILAYDFETVLDDAIPYMFSWFDGSKSGCLHGLNTQQLMEKVMILLNAYADEGYTFIGYNSQKYDNLILIDYFNLDKTKVIKGKGNSLLSISLAHGSFVDVFKFTGRSLADSCKMLEIASPKTTLDHEAVNTEFLETGSVIVTPKMKEYSIKDVTSLYEVWMKLTNMFETLGFHPSGCVSLAQMMFNKFHAVNKPSPPQLIAYDSHMKFREYLVGGKVDCRKGHFKAKPDHTFVMIDRNSMYPAEMIMSNFLKSHGQDLLPTKELVDYGCYDVLVTKVGKVNCIPFKSDLPLDWQKEPPFKTKCLGLDIENHIKHGGRVEILEGYVVTSPKLSNSMFQLIEHIMREKETATGPLREVYKLLANSLSGKLCQQIISVQSTLNFEPKSGASFPVSRNLWCNPTSKERPTVTGSVVNGAMIYSYARASLNDMIAKVGNFYYCDTDSVLYECPIDSIPKDQFHLGGWKVECTGDEIYIGGKKLYSIYQNGELLKSSFKGVVARGLFEDDEIETSSKSWLKRCMDDDIKSFTYAYKGLVRRNFNLRWTVGMRKTIKL